MAKKDEKQLLKQAKNIVAKYKNTKLQAPIEDYQRNPNSEVYGGAIQQPMNESTANKIYKEKYGLKDNSLSDPIQFAKNVINPQGGNMAQHDEDLDNLITALSIFIPAEAMERGGSKLIGGLIKKLGSKNFKAEAVDSALQKSLSKSKGFTSHVIPEASTTKKIETRLDTKPAFEKRNMRNASMEAETKPLQKNNANSYFPDADLDDIHQSYRKQSISQYDNPGKGLNSPKLNEIIDKGDYGLQKGKDGKIYYKDINSDWEPLDPRNGWSRNIIKENFGVDEVTQQMNLLPNIEPEDLRK